MKFHALGIDLGKTVFHLDGSAFSWKDLVMNGRT
jgi:hypothetical protein